MKKLTVSILSAAVLTALSGAAMAEGFYAAVDAGQAKYNISCAGAFACSNTATGVRVSGGYQFTPNVAMEVGYGDFGSMSGSVVDPVLGLATAKFAASGLQVAAVGSLPLSNNFALTGKLGVANTSVKTTVTAAIGAAGVSKSSTTLTAGIGVRYDLSKTVSLRAQYESLGNVTEGATGQKFGLSLLSAGVTFAF